MYHAIVNDHFIKDKTFFKKYPIVEQKVENSLVVNIVKADNPIVFAKDLQQAMISNIPCCSSVYDEGGFVEMVFKDLICLVDPNDKILWEDAKDYISEITKIPCWHFATYPAKINDESLWLQDNNELRDILRTA